MKTAYFNSAAPKEGDVVYPYCQPQKAGIIVAVGNGTISTMRTDVPDAKPLRTRRGTVVRIRQSNGEEYEKEPLGLRCFRTLVEEHERKGAKFRAVLDKLVPPASKPVDRSHEATPLAALDGQKIAPGTWVVVRSRANEWGRKTDGVGYSLELPPVGTWCQCCRWQISEWGKIRNATPRRKDPNDEDVFGTGKVKQFTQKDADAIAERNA